MKQRLNLMRTWLILGAVTAVCSAQQPDRWMLPNFAQRLEMEVSNPGSSPVETVAVVPVREAGQAALRFPGSLAVAVLPDSPFSVLPSQADDLDSDGTADEFVFPVRLGPGETRRVHVYYSTTLRDPLPWPKRVHASHAFGYNRATIALESEAIGYRSYGGFFLDIQARSEGKPGLYNSLVGYFGARQQGEVGRDVIHLGDTLGLGGLYLRAGDEVFRPPVNMPDYAHKPSPPEVPQYRVIADGPVRAVVEARMESWKIGADEVDIRALYSIAAGGTVAECRFRILPVRVSRTYEAGTGVRHLPGMKMDPAPGRIALQGTQEHRIGPLGMALYYDPADAETRAPLATKEDSNEAIAFRLKLEPGRAVSGRYWVAAAWSGSGIKDLLPHLVAVEKEARATVRVTNYRLVRTPAPQRVDGEAD
ncbi:MAG TPA: DUF4861 family protein [Bryobacteraceae bacterium]|nr:DUF4861 family protein [Bryobacteraceae bacterium]